MPRLLRPMRLRIALALEFNSEDAVDSKDWASEKAEQIRQQRERKVVEQKSRLAQEEMKKAFGLQMWRELRALLKERAESLNQELGEKILEYEEAKPNEAEIRIVGQTTGAHLVFHADREALDYRTPAGGGGQLKLKVPRDRLEWCDSADTPQSAERIIDRLLEPLLKEL